MKYKVKDIKLAAEGQQRLSWAEQEMPVLMQIRKEFEKSKPLKGLRVGVCLHVTKETGVLVRTLKAAGATPIVTGSNPLSTQDDVAAALAKEGVNVFAWKHQTNKEYYECLNAGLDLKPQITMDDGADLISLLHNERKDLLKDVLAGQEETTTGVIRLKAMAKDGALKYPVIAVNDTPTKHLFDNFYGTGQSTIDALLRATNVLLAGKTVVIAGYGHCGHGIAQVAAGHGSHVIVTEVDAVAALKASMDGYQVMPMREAAKLGDVFITVTGNKDVIRKEHFEVMKHRAIVANSGHFNVEIKIDDLEVLSKKKIALDKNIDEYQMKNGRSVYLLAGGRLVNLAAAEGHPSSVMDMSFANQALTCAWLAKNYKTLTPGVHDVPAVIDDRVASLKLASMGVKMDKLTPEQEKYLSSWQEGT
jgi:adenosylhomocysteinase